jgi:spore maturation protein CgeB
MRILYAAYKYDYGKPANGLGYEHYNFYDSLVRMGHDVVYFDVASLLAAHGRDRMNALLVEVARSRMPELAVFVLAGDEFDQRALTKVRKAGVPTACWFCDDHSRFESYTARYAHCFSWAVTTAANALPKYARIRYATAIKSQVACNQFLYRPMDLPLAHDVTFVGRPISDRRQLVAALQTAGIDVRAWGGGWEAGRVTQDEMIRIFGQSRINLNFSNTEGGIASVAKRTGDAAFGLARRFVGSARVRASLRHGVRSFQAMLRGSRPVVAPPVVFFEQIKGRNFEVPGCGGFMLTANAEDLGAHYRIGSEVVCYEGEADLVDKTRYYLAHEEERAAIAAAGHERTIREHTYVHRFTEVFQRMGKACVSAQQIIASPPKPGTTEEVS